MQYRLNDVFITATGSYLPGNPVTNNEMEQRLGFVNGQPSRYRAKILKHNGINFRHYALDENGRSTELTEEMAVKAIHAALNFANIDLYHIDMIAAGTTLADILIPGFASMVHGRLGGRRMDILSCGGVCGAGAAAIKAASHTIRLGKHRSVIAVAAERPSAMMLGQRFQNEQIFFEQDGEKTAGFKYFNSEFLRWMLSDGAGAFIMQNKPSEIGPCLKLEWIETQSFANELDTCMYMGTDSTDNYNVKNSWLWDNSLEKTDIHHKLLLRQNTALLAENICRIVCSAARDLQDRDFFCDQSIDHFLPHLSSYFFESKLADEFRKYGIDIPLHKWFTNLSHRGNTGSASIFIILDEALKTAKFKDNDSILLMIPESGRFSVTYALLTVVHT